MAGLPQAEDWCVHGGEDFELVLALEENWARALVAELAGSSLIGRLEAMDGSAEEPVSWQEGDQPATSSSCGYQHFSQAADGPPAAKRAA